MLAVPLSLQPASLSVDALSLGLQLLLLQLQLLQRQLCAQLQLPRRRRGRRVTAAVLRARQALQPLHRRLHGDARRTGLW